MLLELRKLMTSPGETLPFETSVDLSDMPFGGCKPVTEPVLAKGQVRNTAGVLEMTGTVETVLHGICDRCAMAFTRPVQYPDTADRAADLGDFCAAWCAAAGCAAL